MGLSRRLFLVAGAVALGGCTEMMWKDRPQRYAEQIDSVLLSEDGKTLVFIGADYHYIFDAPPVLAATLHAAELHGHIHAELNYFRVDREGKIRGTVTLKLDSRHADNAAELEAHAQQLGYHNKYGAWQATLELQGQRYHSHGFKLPAQLTASTPLSQRYTVTVEAPEAGYVIAGKVAATPVTLAADGALLVGGIVLSPIAIIVFLALLKGGAGGIGRGP